MVKNIIIIMLTLATGFFSYKYIEKTMELNDQNVMNDLLYNSQETTVSYNTTTVITGNFIARETILSVIEPYAEVSYICLDCTESAVLYSIGDIIESGDILFSGNSMQSEVKGEIISIITIDNDVVMNIERFDTLSIEFKLNQAFAGYIYEGQTLVAKYNEEYFDIVISRISSKYDEQFNLTVSSIFLNEENYIPNAQITVLVETESYQDVLLLPTNVISSSDLGYFVNIIDSNNIVKTRYVTIGSSADGMTIILGGVSDGERVVVTN